MRFRTISQAPGSIEAPSAVTRGSAVGGVPPWAPASSDKALLPDGRTLCDGSGVTRRDAPYKFSHTLSAALWKRVLIQGLFGVKAGKRLENIGLFAKIRPGFIHFTRGGFSPNGLCDAIFSGCFSATGLTNFALDLGGIVEVYTSKRTFIRLDVGDTVIRHGRRNQLGTLIAPNGLTSVVIPVKVSTKHNLQTSVGIGFRF